MHTGSISARIEHVVDLRIIAARADHHVLLVIDVLARRRQIEGMQLRGNRARPDRAGEGLTPKQGFGMYSIGAGNVGAGTFVKVKPPG